MNEVKGSTVKPSRVFADVTFIVLGSFIFLGIVQFTEIGFWPAWCISILGVMVSALPHQPTRIIGVGVAIIGVYLMLRFMEIFSLPLLNYGLALSLIFIGTVNVVRGAHGKGAQVTNSIKRLV